MRDEPRSVYSDWDASDDACVRLWRCVVLQAIADASGEGGADELERRAARHFLLDEHSTWSVARTVACFNFGLDPDKLRARFIEAQGRHINGRSYRRRKNDSGGQSEILGRDS